MGVFAFHVTQVSASNTFERSPLGTEVTNPVSYEVTISDIESLSGYLNTQTDWCMAVYDFNGENEYYSEVVPLTSTTQLFEFTLPVGDYYGSYWQVLNAGEIACTSANGATYEDIEGDSTTVIFSVVEDTEPPAPTTTPQTVPPEVYESIVYSNGIMIFYVSMMFFITIFAFIFSRKP